MLETEQSQEPCELWCVSEDKCPVGAGSAATERVWGCKQRLGPQPALLGTTCCFLQESSPGMDQRLVNGDVASTWKLRAAWWLHPQGWSHDLSHFLRVGHSPAPPWGRGFNPWMLQHSCSPWVWQLVLATLSFLGKCLMFGARQGAIPHGKFSWFQELPSLHNVPWWAARKMSPLLLLTAQGVGAGWLEKVPHLLPVMAVALSW